MNEQMLLNQRKTTELSDPLGYKIYTNITAGVDPNYVCLQRHTCDELMSDLSKLETKLSHLHACFKKKDC